jgi:uncharacterized protein (DUF2225 family)
MAKTVDSELKISYMSKEEYVCPVCRTSFHKEELLTGGGRLIAGKITDELHRLYDPSIKYGEIYPLAYPAIVCPECWFAAIDKDFLALSPEGKKQADEEREKRFQEIRLIFPTADFTMPRDLVNGAASWYLVIMSYRYFPVEFSPTIKMGIAALRGGWLLDELHAKFPGYHYDWLSLMFKRKAQYFYNEAVLNESSGKETLSGIKNFGPDTDKNYAYEGALYLAGLLQYKYGSRSNLDVRVDALGAAKRTIAKIFGLGKSSKSKPGPLLEHGRALYDNINKELNETDE